ncbi:putative DNA-binding transcriptional regulator AlpA [Amaricoccus macauensis]|uniref:Putative DNA-binding transcriptional regulator AlpA n=1 Tax=Amaricoccus macauensis TaxID=57001 RepID=A0A840SP89_9RHOB|nr:hypothetical protein [Amaricoccus macauensis]MBB5222834.1 putative DNA-binding transcriptional regulator AlpA [Amaricoccus macauensis]
MFSLTAELCPNPRVTAWSSFWESPDDRPQVSPHCSGTATLLGLSVVSVWRHVNDGIVSRPIRIGGATRWVLDELIEAISAAEAKR